MMPKVTRSSSPSMEGGVAPKEIPDDADNAEFRVVEPGEYQSHDDLTDDEGKEEQGLVKADAEDRLVEK